MNKLYVPIPDHKCTGEECTKCFAHLLDPDNTVDAATPFGLQIIAVFFMVLVVVFCAHFASADDIPLPGIPPHLDRKGNLVPSEAHTAFVLDEIRTCQERHPWCKNIGVSGKGKCTCWKVVKR